MMPRILLASILLYSAFNLSAEDVAGDLQKRGIDALKASQTKPDAIVAAARYFAEASMKYEADGRNDLAVEANSFLYYCKKKMTNKDVDAFLKDEAPTVTARIKEVEANTIGLSEAQTYLDRADKFAKVHPTELFLITVRYFEVAERFKDTDAGRSAMNKSLEAMQKVIGSSAEKFNKYKPAATDGRAFIKSIPAGATILLVSPDGEKLDTGKLTPALIQLPIGPQDIELTFKTSKPATLHIEIDGANIFKPDTLTLEPKTVPIDIVFEDGWRVFVSDHVAKPSNGGATETPCTVELPLGDQEVCLVKPGFVDIHQKVKVEEEGIRVSGDKFKNSMELKIKPTKGTSKLSSRDLLALIDPSRDAINGKWQIQNGRLLSDSSTRGILQIPYHPPTEYDLVTEFSMSKRKWLVLILAERDTQFEFQIGWENKAGFELVSDKRSNNNETTRAFTVDGGRRYKVTIKVRNNQVSAYIDDKLISELKTDYKNLSLHDQWQTPDHKAIAVTTDDTFNTFYSITVTEISGPGEISRK